MTFHFRRAFTGKLKKAEAFARVLSMSAYRGEKLDVPAHLEAVRHAAVQAGFSLFEYGAVAGYPLLRLDRAANPATGGNRPAPRLYASTGVHGDEPAGPLGLLRLLEENAFSSAIAWTLFPLINPVGLAAGTRGNALGIDLNRDYALLAEAESRLHTAAIPAGRFDAAFCLHEDWETTGFYLFELNTSSKPSVAPAVFRAVEPIVPIETLEEIDGHILEAGLVYRNEPPERPDWPEAFILIRDHTDRSYTFETPSNAATLEQRARAQAAALTAAAEAVLAEHTGR